MYGALSLLRAADDESYETFRMAARAFITQQEVRSEKRIEIEFVCCVFGAGIEKVTEHIVIL